MPKDIKKIMLVTPANTMPKDSVRRLTTPLGLMYLGAVLRDSGYDVNILDSTCEGYSQTRIQGDYLSYGLSDEDFKKRVQDYRPDLVGVTSMFTAQQHDSMHHCNLVKQVFPDVPVVIGGIHPSLAPRETAENKSVDYVVMGEGEYRMLKLIDCLNQGKTDFEFDGIAYKKDGKVVLNPMMDRIENLDALPLPARDLVDMEKYLSIGISFNPFPRRERVEQVMTSRGCPFNCNFCSTVQYWGHHFRTRSAESVIDEIQGIVSNYGIQEIQFSDDNLTANKERAKNIFRKMAPMNLSWCTPNGLMIQTLDEEMVHLMADSGAYQLTFPVESGSERVRKEIIQKPVPPKEKVKGLVELCQSRDVQVHGLFIVGFPGETRQEMDETLRYPFEVGFNSASFFIANPMPGSRLYAECKRKGYLDEEHMRGNVKKAEMKIPPTSPDYVMSNEELEALVDKTAKEFKEFAMKRDSNGWRVQHEQFLKRHGDQADLLLGRVT